MRKCIIFGAGNTGEKVFNEIKDYEIIGVVDNDKSKWGIKTFGEMVIEKPKKLIEIEYDKIVIASLVGYKSILEQLYSMGISDEKIDKTFINTNILIDARIVFLKQFASMCTDIEGSVAEAGVFQGEFAKEINGAFPNRKLYLFDTFEGFDDRDIKVELKQNKGEVKSSNQRHFELTSEELVLSKLPIQEKCIIKKGFFPETTVGLENEKFCFVNLDMDLYKPTLEGLKFFYPRMSKGGCILIHDYFSDVYSNIKQAIKDFEEEKNIILNKLPIGDELSLAIII